MSHPALNDGNKKNSLYEINSYIECVINYDNFPCPKSVENGSVLQKIALTMTGRPVKNYHILPFSDNFKV